MAVDSSIAKGKPGVRSIAKATGLSTATVSRVLNGAANVRPETREQVLAAIRDSGYLPDPAARALSTRRTRTIAAVIPTLAHSIFARFLNAIELKLAAKGYALVIGTTDGDAAAEHRRVEEMLNLGAEGLILSGAEHLPELYELIQQRGLPTVCTSTFEPGAALPTIGYDNQALGGEALAHLQSLGHRRIAVVHGPAANNDRTRLRIKGVRALAAASTTLTLIEKSLDVAGGVAAAGDLLEAGQGPTAILCLSDVLALGVLFEAARRGIAVPASLSVMGFDDLDWAAFAEPPLTSIGLPVTEMGEQSALALVESLDEGRDIAHRRLDAKIVLRGSTAAPP